MKIAATYENGQIFQHFGHTEQFKIYTVADGSVTSSAVLPTLGSGHGALASLLRAQGVNALVCGGIGAGAKTALAEAGIQLYAGITGSADQAVEQLLAGTLAYHNNATCQHHGHEHHGSCGSHEGHTCGSHGCGHGHHDQ